MRHTTRTHNTQHTAPLSATNGTIMTVDTNVTPENVETQTPENVETQTPVSPLAAYPDVQNAVAALHAACLAAVHADDDDTIAGLTATIAFMRKQKADMSATIAGVERDIAARRLALSNDAGVALANALRPDVLRIIAALAPAAVETDRPSSRRNGKSNDTVKTVARTVAEIDADPSVAYVGAPLADLDAIGHDCALVSIMRNGCKLVAHLKQQITKLEESDAPGHEDCFKVAAATRVLFRRRAALRNE